MLGSVTMANKSTQLAQKWSFFLFSDVSIGFDVK